MPSSKIRLFVIIVVLVLVAGAGFGLYKYRSTLNVQKSQTQASTPKQYSVTVASPANNTAIGVSITCTAKEVQNQSGNVTGWDVTINGDNADMVKQSTTVKLHVPWNTTLEAQDHVTGIHHYDGPTPPVVIASAETFAAGTLTGALAQCDLPIPTGAPAQSQACPEPVWAESEIADQVRGFVPNDSFDNVANPQSVLQGGNSPILIKLQRSADKKTVTGTVTNDSDKCMTVSMGVYKMYEAGKVSSQKYFSGNDSVVVLGNTSKSFSAALPDCMAQVDIYGTGTAPRQQLDSYLSGADGPPFMGSAFHLNQHSSVVSAAGPFCTDTPTDNPPQGSFDLADCTHVVGWAVDKDVPTQSLDVHIYRDGAAGQGGIFVGSFRADQSRPDVNTALGVTGNHGFNIPTPEVFKDGKSHTIYVYAINLVSGKVNPLLGGSPKTINCQLPPPPAQCKLDITKFTNSATVAAGDEIEYIIDVKNSGSTNCTGNVKIEDTYDAGVTFVRESHSSNVVRGYAATNTPFHNTTTRTLTWDANVLSAGETAQIQWYATANAIAQCTQATVQNKARVTAKEYNNLQDFVTSNTVVTTVTASCPPPPGQNTDVGVEKTVSPSLITVGQTTTFTIKVKNNGPLAATAVVLKDTLPAGLSFVSYTVTKGTFASETGIWNIGALAVSEQQQLQIVTRGDVVGTKVNTAVFTTIQPSDTNPNNNQAQASVTVVAPQVAEVVCAPGTQSIYVNQPATFAAVGGTGTYSWNATGGSPATGAGTSFSTQYSSVGQKSVVVTSGDKQATCVVMVQDVPVFNPSLDIAVTKQVSPAVILVGQSATFTVTATNRTQVTATNVRLSDVLPQGLTLVSATPSQGVWNAGSGAWDVGAMTAGATVSATVQVTGSQVGSFTNRIDLTSSNPQDSDSSNNSATATLIVQTSTSGQPLICALSTGTVTANQVVTAYASGGTGSYSWSAVGGTPSVGANSSFSTGFTVAGTYTIVVTSGSSTAQCVVQVSAPVVSTRADLSLTKIVSPVSIASGGQAIYTITVTNDGPGVPSMVTVKDELPAGVEYVSSAAGRGSYDRATSIWTIGSIGVGEQVTLLITVKSTHVGQHVNIAQVWTSDLPDVDSTPGNSNPNEDDEAAATLTVTGGLVNAGVPIVPITALGLLCAFAALSAIKIKTQRQARLQTPMGEVSLDLD